MVKNDAKTKVAKKAVSAKKPKLIEKKDWSTLTPEDCLKSIKTACHLSSKSVNSNASAVGIRLDPAQRLMLPYVAVSTLDAAKIPVDYVTGATDAGPLRQICCVLDGSAKDFFNQIDPEQVSMIEDMGAMMLAGASVGTGFIDPRLRQLIWPTGDGDAPWVALTPLQSSGLSDVIRRRLSAESDAHINPETGKSRVYRANAVFGIGGSNSQNVGRYVRAMQKPLVFDGPKENQSLRLATAFYYKGYLRGLAFAAPRKETRAFALWRHPMRKDNQANQRKMPSNAAIRQEESEHIHAIAAAAIGAADAAREILLQHREHLDGLTSPTLNPFLRAMIDRDLRDRDFKKTFAKELINSIERFKYKISGDEYIVSADGGLAALISIAEEVAL